MLTLRACSYKTCSVASAIFSLGCRIGGETGLADIAAGGAIVAAGAEGAVKWSKTSTGQAAATKAKGAAVAMGSAMSSAAKSAGDTTLRTVSTIGKATSGAVSWATGSSKKVGDLEAQAKKRREPEIEDKDDLSDKEETD